MARRMQNAHEDFEDEDVSGGENSESCADDVHEAPVGDYNEIDEAECEDDGEEDDNEEDEESEEEESEEELPTRREVPQRSNRGSRMSTIHAEGDDEFWGQAFWQEEADDELYSTEEEERDVLDADFFLPEEQELNEEVRVASDRSARKIGYVDPILKAAALAARRKSAAAQPKPSQSAPDAPIPSSRSRRESTRQRTEDQMEKEKSAREAALSRPKKQKVEHCVLTQEQRMEEAKLTELLNRESLEEMLRLEDERKRARYRSKQKEIPMIRFLSTREGNTITFTQTDQFPDYLLGQSKSPPSVRMCKITGQRAKYIDPLTKEPYATAEAFKALRERRQPLPMTSVEASGTSAST